MTGGTMGVDFVMERTVKGKDGDKATLDVLIEEYGKTTLPYASKSGGEKVKACLLYTSLQTARFDAVLLGHIHRPQMLEGLENVFYSGAINAMNFNDEGQKRGFWIHEFEKKSLKKGHLYETPYRKFQI